MTSLNMCEKGKGTILVGRRDYIFCKANKQTRPRILSMFEHSIKHDIEIHCNRQPTSFGISSLIYKYFTNYSFT